MTGPRLTDRQRAFVEEYLVDLNGAAAAVRAGAKRRTANRTASRWLSNADILAAIDAAMAARSERTKITQDRVLKELAAVGFSNVRDFIVDDAGDLQVAPDVDAQAVRAIASVKRKVRIVPGARKGSRSVTRDVEVEYRLWPKVEALKLLGQHVGLWFKQVKHSGEVAVNVSGGKDLARRALAGDREADLADRILDELAGGGDQPAGSGAVPQPGEVPAGPAPPTPQPEAP